MYYVYKIKAKLEGQERYYVGLTRDLIQRMEQHRASARFKHASSFNYEVLCVTSNVAECLEQEFHEIDIALGKWKPDGNREHFEGACLNRTSIASIPLSKTQHLCFSKSKGYFIK
jgi:predicted GIY-YIG superfamily endonuclease